MDEMPHDVITKLLLGAEASTHRGGWNQDPFLATIELPRPHFMTLAKLPLEIANPPGDFVYFSGKLFTQKPEFAEIVEKRSPHFYGTAFVCEGWSAPPDMTEQQHRDKLRPGKGYADMPGAREQRIVIAIDLFGRTYSIHRIRGEKPTAEKPSTEVAGQVPEGLRLMTLALARLLPDNDRYLTALGNLDIPIVKVIDDRKEESR